MRYVVAVALIGSCFVSLAAGVMGAALLLVAPLPLSIDGTPVGFMSSLGEDGRLMAAFLTFSVGTTVAVMIDWLHQNVAGLFDRVELRRFLFVRDEMAKAVDRAQADAWFEARLLQEDAAHLIPLWVARQDSDGPRRRHELKRTALGATVIVAVASSLLAFASYLAPYAADAFGRRTAATIGAALMFGPFVAFMLWDWRRLGRGIFG